jgi:hypothetical protein
MGHREKVFIDGVQAPSVTEVLGIVRKPFLEFWRGKLGNAKCETILRESQDIGHEIHEAIECYFQGQPLPEMGQQSLRMFAHFREWALMTGASPIDLELQMQSNEFKFHGTCDAVLEIDGKLLMADWKTSSAIDKLYGAQLAAYSQMYKEISGKEITEGLIVRMDKKEKSKKQFEVREFHDLPRYFEVFKACLAVHNFVNGKDA